ncbi:hypothetical protein H9L39_10223 [Fusarium oxysporum f. sp. albedinis]|nr:hypothetical protein H9L39_10223 [Fusarium oxysporum f. sp. albedinis]
MATELNTDDGRCLVMEWKSTVIEIPRSQYRQACEDSCPRNKRSVLVAPCYEGTGVTKANLTKGALKQSSDFDVRAGLGARISLSSSSPGPVPSLTRRRPSALVRGTLRLQEFDIELFPEPYTCLIQTLRKVSELLASAVTGTSLPETDIVDT